MVSPAVLPSTISSAPAVSAPTRLRLPDLLFATDRGADDVLSGHYDHLLPAGGPPRDERWYTRLYGDDELDLWLISWVPDRSTEMHDHGGSLGALTVVSGVLLTNYAEVHGWWQSVYTTVLTVVGSSDVEPDRPPLARGHHRQEGRCVGGVERAVDEGRAGLGAADDVVGRGVHGRRRTRDHGDLVEHGRQCALVGDQERPHAGVVPRSVCADGCARRARRRLPPAHETQARGSSLRGIPPLPGHPCRKARQRAVHTPDYAPLHSWRRERSARLSAARRRGYPAVSPSPVFIGSREISGSGASGITTDSMAPPRNANESADSIGAASDSAAGRASCGSDGRPAHSAGSSGRVVN